MKVKKYEELLGQQIEIVVPTEIGCGFCWNKKRKQNKELFFLDTANNMRECTFCPSCGRRLDEEV